MSGIDNGVDADYEFKAVIVSERYYNEDTSWGCYNFSTTDDIPYLKRETRNPFSHDGARGADRMFGTLAGRMQQLAEGGTYTVRAALKQDKKYGMQYVPESVCADVPKTRDEQLLFLKALVSESVAESLLDVYPNVVEDVMSGRTDEIDYSKVKGVGKATWEKVKNKIVDNYLVSDIIIMLRPLGMTYAMIRRLLASEPNPVLLKQKIEQNPYILTRVNGIGFKKCDALALKMKPELADSNERLVAFVQFFLAEMGESQGHTWCTAEALKNAASDNVRECINRFDWLLSNSDFLFVDNGRIGLRSYHDIEMEIRRLMLDKAAMTDKVESVPDAIIDAAIKESEKEQGFEYTQEQGEAIRKTLKRPLSVIVGYAGTGKTSIMRAIIRACQMNDDKIAASALSAMAAQRITEATGFPATTIHRTLGCKGPDRFEFDETNPLLADVAFLDEGSMVNAVLLLRWLRAIKPRTRIVISGDDGQLPPIGFGNAFTDMITQLDDGAVSRLSKPMRQAEKSGILTDANIIRKNRNPITEKIQPKIIHGELGDMYYMFRKNRQSLFDIAVRTFFKSIETDGVDNVVIAVPRKQNCINCTSNLNATIQDRLLADMFEQIKGDGVTFKLGAKVMQTVNDYDKNVFNGEIGYITEIGTRPGEKGKDKGRDELYCVVTFKDALGNEKKVDYAKKDLSALDLAYAMTVHKLQGAGRDTVIGIIDNTHYKLLDSCLLYTMLTRAKKRCLLLAEPDAFQKCIRSSGKKRDTWLSLAHNKVFHG